MKNSILFGLLAGLLSVALITGLYVSEKALLVSGWERLTWLIILTAMIAAVFRERSAQAHGFIHFQPIFKLGFQVFLIAYIVKFACIYLLFSFDPELMELAKNLAIEILKEFKAPDTPDTVYQQQLEQFEKADFGPRLFDVGIMIEIIIGSFIAAIIAFFVKREPPEWLDSGSDSMKKETT